MNAHAAAEAPVELQLYRVHLRDDTRRLVQCMRALSPHEQARANRARDETGYRRYVVLAVTVREILGRYLDLAPRAVPLDEDANGRAVLRADGADGVRFAVAHAGDLALVAISSARVGASLDTLRALPDALAFAGERLTPSEVRALGQLDASAQGHAVLRCLVGKAAVLDALGEPAGASCAHFAIEPGQPRQQIGLPDLLPVDRPAALHVLHGRTGVLTLVHVEPAPGFTAAVAVCAGALSLRWQSWAS